MKRKAEAILEDGLKKKQNSVSGNLESQSAFQNNIFEVSNVNAVQHRYQTSSPYPHAVVPSLITDTLLRSVRKEITTHVSFTLKETDIYRIHQSGDLANLSNLDSESLKLLPSLVQLRDALYCDQFREWVSTVTGAGKVSGRRTDMAVNVYTPGSYLLCHDDVIGSRRVSYILYLTDPDHPWKPHWGGGLRLYPTEEKRNKEGEPIKVPSPNHTLNIPPAAGQLSFFAVRPGESYHDVEEVYHGPDSQENKKRIRIAISGWYHIPEPGEEGYEHGLEGVLAQKSSLTQLKGAASEFDEPRLVFKHFDEPRKVMDSHAQKAEVDPGDDLDHDEDILTEQDLTFLLHYISPGFLTPDMIEEFAQSFEETSVLQLERFLNEKFANELNQHIVEAEAQNGSHSSEKDHPSRWKIARPPHKHRFAYIQSSESRHRDSSPISRLLADLLHSHAFKKWLALITGLKVPSLVRQYAIARRFRRGDDYALASQFQGEQPQLEFTISMTPTSGWEIEDGEEEKNPSQTNGHSNFTTKNDFDNLTDELEFGGEEVYMVGDEDNDNDSIHSKSLPRVGKRSDPAVYKSIDADEDDGVLFTNAPSWNLFSVVLRDKGTLRFVKYISKAAKGDRWDIKGEVELADDAFEGEDSQNDEEIEHEENDDDDNDNPENEIEE